MLTTETPRPGLLFGSLLFRSDVFTQAALLKHWEDTYGESLCFEPTFNPLAKYYSKEMGEEALLRRFFVVTKQAYARDALLQGKLQALQWEKQWSLDGKRQVNIDIGLLSAENFILATTKNYSHRVFIGENIFADLTYYFHQGKLQTFAWTYPDYLDQMKMDFFEKARTHLLRLK